MDNSVVVRVLRFGAEWNDVMTEAYKLRQTVLSYEKDNCDWCESENIIFPQIELLMERLVNLYNSFELSLLQSHIREPEHVRAKVQELEEIQHSLTELHNRHDEIVSM
jgi:hypothetical protein